MGETESSPGRLEQLRRYIARPPLPSERLSLSSKGKVLLGLRAPFRDEATHFMFEHLVFIERLAAPAPPLRLPSCPATECSRQARADAATSHAPHLPGSSWARGLLS